MNKRKKVALRKRKIRAKKLKLRQTQQPAGGTSRSRGTPSGGAMPASASSRAAASWHSATRRL